MKSMFIAFCLAFILALMGCATLDQVYQPPPAKFCLANPGVVLCRVTDYLQTTPESLKEYLTDATLLPVAANLLTAEEVYEMLNSIVLKLEAPSGAVSFNRIIQDLLSGYQVNPAALALVNRRLAPLYQAGAGDLTLDQPSLQYMLGVVKDLRDMFWAFLPKKDSRGN